MNSLVPGPVRILVVDDEPGLRQMLQILLRREGYEPLLAPGFEQAVEAIEGTPRPFPVVLTDLAMPDGSGLDVLAAAKRRSKETEIIMMTAHSSVPNAVSAMRAGAFNFVA
jgi:two-component system response regulator PilR (NtrC family)